jgi:hypothetical protein
MYYLFEDDLRSRARADGNRNLGKLTIALLATHIPLVILILVGHYLGWFV